MATQLTPPLCYHGEGAVWSPTEGGLKWVDMLAGDVLSLDRQTGAVGRLRTGSSVAAAVRPRFSGGLLIVTEREFTLWAGEVKVWSSPPLWSDPDRRFNEGGCDPQGRMLCGSMSYQQEAGAGEVYRLGVDRAAQRLFGEVTISNGLGFNASGDQMFYVDTPTRRIDLFDAAGAELTGRRPFVHIAEGVGNPDGLCVDESGGVWVALYGGSAVHHYDADGRLADVVELPVSNVTSCTLGGPDLDVLFVTTSRENLGDAQPQAGAVFSVDVGVRGLPVLPYAG